MSRTASALIALATAEVGYLEKKTNSQLDSKTANAGYNNYTKYGRDLRAAGYYNGNKNGYAWCDQFVDWLFYQLCDKNAMEAQKMIYQTGDLGASCRYSAQYYRKANRFYKYPKIGDQIFFGEEGAETHTGVVCDYDDNKVYTIEGNTSGASGVIANGGGVYNKSYPLKDSKIVGYGRPNYDDDTSDSIKCEQVDIKLEEISKGSVGNQVKTVQRILKDMGYDLGRYGVDGDFGPMTDKAVKAFQKDKKLEVDGIVGINTWTKLLKG